jgi:hypothetical protein
VEADHPGRPWAEPALALDAPRRDLCRDAVEPFEVELLREAQERRGLARDEAVAGFALITAARPSIQLAELDYVKVVVGWSPLDGIIDPDTGEVVEVPLGPVPVE